MRTPFMLMSLQDMMALPFGQLLTTHGALVACQQMLSSYQHGKPGRDLHMNSEAYAKLLAHVQLFGKLCGEVGLMVSQSMASSVLIPLQEAARHDIYFLLPPNLMMRIEFALTQVNNCLRHEAPIMVALTLPASSIPLYDPSGPLFGNEVDAKFPAASIDIAEAGKCLALERSTAAAFHAIRCLECGIGAISRSLGIPDPTKGADRNWGSMLKKVKAEIDRRWPDSASRFSGDGEVFEGLYGVLAALQNPYRNATMHLDLKYTPDEAKHIFEMTKGLMQKIASRMDQGGLPLV